jgi:hypothetical protein
MASPGTLRRVTLVRIYVSVKLSTTIIRVTRIRSHILVTLMMEALSFSDTSILTRATRRNGPEDAVIQCYFLKCNSLFKSVCTVLYLRIIA